ncbi:hypothetical protein Pint_00088 [Pistacia integerrima]|uniref:Uncharacterized protein n=1 Tax=Pistacia integerrima TaxID=434235 RepID=A0ACC0ZM88_9ROSI|nr:hypothetical protein Pint_00088 [Pistacia integerrima]
MEGKGESSYSSCTSAMTLNELGLSRLPQHYVLPPSEQPKPGPTISDTIPIVDISSLQNPALRSHAVDEIRRACKEIGSFQVLHCDKPRNGIPLSIMKDVLDAATEFFNLPIEEKMLLVSDNVHEPVRYGTSVNHTRDKVHYWRDFIKHYSHPIAKWIHLWPSMPPSYKEKTGNYAKAVQLLQKQLLEVILETLGLNINYLQEDIEEGLQVMAVNCHPAYPEPDLALGMPPHSDYGSLTIVLQSGPGLQLIDHNKNWLSVPPIEGALIVQLGDQIEVMSNGQHKSIAHRGTLRKEKKRLSIASLHSLDFNTKIRPAPELPNEQQPVSYKEFSFNDFLDFISSNDIAGGRFIDTLKINP